MTDTLMRRPALARNVAAYISLWTGAEMMVAAFVEKLLGPGNADKMLGQVPTISQRMEIVERLLKSHEATTPWADAALKTIPELRQANSYRVKIVHGLYSEDGKGGALLAGNLFDRRRPFAQEAITAESVMVEYRKLEQLMLRIVAITKQPFEPLERTG